VTISAAACERAQFSWSVKGHHVVHGNRQRTRFATGNHNDEPELFQEKITARMKATASPGFATASATWRNTGKRVTPSMVAARSSSGSAARRQC